MGRWDWWRVKRHVRCRIWQSIPPSCFLLSLFPSLPFSRIEDPNWRWFCPTRDIWQCPVSFWVAIGIWCIDTKDAVKHPTIYRTVLHSTELSRPECEYCGSWETAVRSCKPFLGEVSGPRDRVLVMEPFVTPGLVSKEKATLPCSKALTIWECDGGSKSGGICGGQLSSPDWLGLRWKRKRQK